MSFTGACSKALQLLKSQKAIMKCKKKNILPIFCQTAVRIFRPLVQSPLYYNCKRSSNRYLSRHGHITSCSQLCVVVVTCVYMSALCVFESDGGGGGVVQATGSKTVCQDEVSV